jgi:hypothetical protein
MRVFIGIPGLLLLVACSVSFSQNLLNGPESVAFDSLHDRYLVSNYYDGSIVQMDEDGNQSYFVSGLGHCLGNTIAGNTLYASTVDSLVMGLDLATAQIVAVFGLPAMGIVDGMTTDTSGFLYVVDTGGRIFKVDPATGSYSVFATDDFTPGLQDIIFDAENNRLLAVSYYQNAPIQGVNLSDSTVYTVVATSFGYFDGITRDQFGNTYVASYSNNGAIYRYDPEFALGPELISSPHQGPAGLDYNRRDNILAVPNFYGNTVDLIPINVSSTASDNIPDRLNLPSNYPNPFNSSTVIEFSLTGPEDITLEIFDNLGRRIETLAGYNYPAGEHRVIWNAGGLSSGIYFYRIKTAQYDKSRKMVLLK